LPVEGSQKLDGIKTLFFVTAVKEKEKYREVVYIVLNYKHHSQTYQGCKLKIVFLVIYFVYFRFLNRSLSIKSPELLLKWRKRKFDLF